MRSSTTTRLQRLWWVLVGASLVVLATGQNAAAQEQDGNSGSHPITVSPAEVPEADTTVTFSVSRTDWNYPKIGIIPCAYPTSGLLDDIVPSTCSIAAITEHIPVDGAFDVEVELPVGEFGVAVVVTTADATGDGPTAAAVVLVPTSKVAANAQDQLARTGVSTEGLLGGALALVGAGATMLAIANRWVATRRLS